MSGSRAQRLGFRVYKLSGVESRAGFRVGALLSEVRGDS